jgi:hypothetical protein
MEEPPAALGLVARGDLLRAALPPVRPGRSNRRDLGNLHLHRREFGALPPSIDASSTSTIPDASWSTPTIPDACWSIPTDTDTSWSTSTIPGASWSTPAVYGATGGCREQRQLTGGGKELAVVGARAKNLRYWGEGGFPHL